METIHWRRAGHELAICTWWYDHTALPARRRESGHASAWATVAVHSARDVLCLLPYDRETVQKVRGLLAAEGTFNVMRLSDREVIEQLTCRLASRRWRLLRDAPVVADLPGDTAAPAAVMASVSSPAPAPLARSAPSPAPPPPPAGPRPAALAAVSAPSAPTPANSHWIEIALIGEDNRPIPGEAYVVELPDGSRRSGRLDGQGTARIADVAVGGMCKVCFPRLDQDAWDLASTAQGSRADALAQGAPA